MILDLSDSECLLLKDHISRLGVIPLSEEDWKQIAPERREAVTRVIMELESMHTEDRGKYAKDLFGEELDEGQENERLEEATSRLIEQAPGRWATMSETDQEYIVRLVDRLETEGLRLKDEATRKRMPELRKLMDLTSQEWQDISAENERRILIKLQDLADHTESEEDEGNHKVRFVSKIEATQLIERLKAGDQEAHDIVIKYVTGEVLELRAS